MNKRLPMLLILLSIIGSVAARDVVNFNHNWKFARFGSMADGTFLDEPNDLDEPSYDDMHWRKLSVPHDWGIEGPFRDDLPNRTGKLSTFLSYVFGRPGLPVRSPI